RGLFAPRPRVNPRPAPDARPNPNGRPDPDPAPPEHAIPAQDAIADRLPDAPGFTGDAPALDQAAGLTGAPGLTGDNPALTGAPGVAGAPGVPGAPGLGILPGLDSAAPAPPGTVPPVPSTPSGPATPSRPGNRPGGRGARHVAPSPSRRPGRTSSPAVRRSQRSRLAALAITAIRGPGIGLPSAFRSQLSAEPTAQAFLFAWQEQHYEAAGGLSTAPQDAVAAELKDAIAELDATQLFLSMKSVVQHGGIADASFMAKVTLAQQGRVWTYQG